jgi:hypothetical protein
MDQYKLICKYISVIPSQIKSFQDVVTFPAATFKVQAAAAKLNVDLIRVEQYLAGMQERLEQIQKVSREYIATVRSNMPAAVNAVLQKGYADAYHKGESDFSKHSYNPQATPKFRKPDKQDGATQLAAYLAHAVALGYHDSFDTGNRGPQQTGQPIRRW